MNISVNGIIVNQSGELLVIKRDDTRTWALPGGALDEGELPTEGVIREVEEETGFKVLPVRLVSVKFVPFKENGYIDFVFRCLMRGGEPKTSAESLRVGYVKTKPLAVRMLAFHKSRAEEGLNHLAGTPTWGTYNMSAGEQLGSQLLFRGLYPAMKLRSKLMGSKPYIPPAQWQISAHVVVRNAAGEVLWEQDGADSWRLPGGSADAMEAPWDAAVRCAKAMTGLDIVLRDLTGVYVKEGVQEMAFVFSAETSTTVPSPTATWRAADAENGDAVAAQREFVADAVDSDRELTVFKRF